MTNDAWRVTNDAWRVTEVEIISSYLIDECFQHALILFTVLNHVVPAWLAVMANFRLWIVGKQ